jgi:hypothetical protein
MMAKSKSEDSLDFLFSKDVATPLVAILDGRSMAELTLAKEIVDEMIAAKRIESIKIGDMVSIPIGRKGDKLKVQVYGITKDGIIIERIDGKKFGNSPRKSVDPATVEMINE